MISEYTLVSGGVFMLDVIMHLAAIGKRKEGLRRVTKVLLMPLLAVCFLFIWRDAGGKPVPWLVIAALLFGCAGDKCLIHHHHAVGFPLGLAAFAVGHVLYILQMLELIVMPEWWIIVLLALVYGAGVMVTFKKLLPYLPGKLRYGCLLYTILLSAFSATAAVGVFTSFSFGAVCLFAGTLMFLLSDTVLSFEIFKGETKNGNLKVMITYIAAQMMIAAGFFLRMI